MNFANFDPKCASRNTLENGTRPCYSKFALVEHSPVPYKLSLLVRRFRWNT